MKRRDFLRGLVAAAVATQLPMLPEAEAKTLVDKGVEELINITIGGRAPNNVRITNVGKGWFRFEAAFQNVSESRYFELDTKHLEQGSHLTLSSTPSQNGKADYWFSCYIKSGNEFIGTKGKMVTLKMGQTEFSRPASNLLLWSEK